MHQLGFKGRSHLNEPTLVLSLVSSSYQASYAMRPAAQVASVDSHVALRLLLSRAQLPALRDGRRGEFVPSYLFLTRGDECLEATSGVSLVCIFLMTIILKIGGEKVSFRERPCKQEMAVGQKSKLLGITDLGSSFFLVPKRCLLAKWTMKTLVPDVS